MESVPKYLHSLNAWFAAFFNFSASELKIPSMEFSHQIHAFNFFQLKFVSAKLHQCKSQLIPHFEKIFFFEFRSAVVGNFITN